MNLSIVISVFNEESSLPILFDEITQTMASLPHVWEVIFVNDGSTDKSLDVLRQIEEKDPQHVRVVVFRRNFGQTAAITAGIDYSRGDIIILMDADLQNDPADIPNLLAKLDEGYDMVSGWRKLRKDNTLTRTIPSVIANSLISWVTGVHLHDYGCTLKAYRRDALEGFRLYGEMHRFIPVFAHSIGASITEIPVHHRARRFGKANYGLERIFKVVLDLVTVKFLLNYSIKPMRLFGGTGLLLFFSSAVLMAFLFIRRTFQNISVIESPLFQLAIMISILGFQSILMGLMAELLARTYHESQKKLTYTVREVIQKKPADD
jgi:glycosyltransferase involved in cell wall biosynthesis